MKFSRRLNLILILLLIGLNFILRITINNHEIFTDSYELHVMANSLSEFGEARWWVTKLSIIGMYPNSYASAIPFFTSGTSLLSDLDIELGIYISGIIFGVFCIFASYLLAECFYDDDLFKFFVAFGFSTSTGILTYTTWTAPARGLFIVMLPLFIYALMKFKKNKPVFGLITIVLSLLLLAIHHLAYYLIPIFVSYATINFAYAITNHFKLVKYEKYVPFLIILSFGFMVFFPFITNKFMIGGSKWASLSIMFNEYPRYIGITSLIAFQGFIYLLFKPKKQREEWTLLSMLLFLTIFIFNPMYMKWLVIIFAILLAGIGFMNIAKLSNKNKRIAIFMIISILILSTTFSAYFQNIHTYRSIFGTTRHIENDSYSAALWINGFTKGNLISNDLWKTWHFAIYSEVPFITGSAVDDQIYGFSDVRNYELRANPIISEEFWLNSPYVRVKGETSFGIWKKIMERSIDNNVVLKLINEFNFTYVVQNKNMQNNMFSKHGYFPSNFMKSIYEEKNCVYDNGNTNIWKLL